MEVLSSRLLIQESQILNEDKECIKNVMGRYNDPREHIYILYPQHTKQHIDKVFEDCKGSVFNTMSRLAQTRNMLHGFVSDYHTDAPQTRYLYLSEDRASLRIEYSVSRDCRDIKKIEVVNKTGDSLITFDVTDIVSAVYTNIALPKNPSLKYSLLFINEKGERSPPKDSLEIPKTESSNNR